jgi:hypothetical protein
MAVICAYVGAIDIWPDNMAVSPSPICRRAFRPFQTSTNRFKPRHWRAL